MVKLVGSDPGIANVALYTLNVAYLKNVENIFITTGTANGR